MVRALIQEESMRINRQDLADLLVEVAHRYRVKGIFTWRRQSRSFYFRLSDNLVLAARAVLDGSAELLGGPGTDVCLNPRCVTYAAHGDHCPHESRERVCEANGEWQEPS
jgi:hypothetical protein